MKERFDCVLPSAASTIHLLHGRGRGGVGLPCTGNPGEYEMARRAAADPARLAI